MSMLVELGLSLSSDREEKMLWELFPCSDWENLEPLAGRATPSVAVLELSQSQSHSLVPQWHWDRSYDETEGAHLLGDTEAWNREKTLECLGFGLEMAGWQRGSGFLLPALSSESLPGGVVRTLPGSALLLPLL